MKWLLRILAKTLKICGITIALVLLLLYLIPLLFPGKVAASVKNWANSNLDAQLNFSKTNLSFFTYFPAFTVSLHDFTMTGSSPFKNDTLIAAKKISFGIDLQSLFFESRTRINKIFLDNAQVHIQVNENGAANYNVYRPKTTTTVNNTSDSSSASLKLEKIVIKQTDFIYNDASLDLFIKAKDLNYKGAGDLSKAIFDLKSHIDIDSLDLTFAHEPYLQHKKIDADLITQINTNSLALIFERNDLRINQLPVQFKGTFDFLSNGYAMDFTASFQKSNLHDLFSALPPQYVNWLDQTEVKGETDLAVTLQGQYIASENINPNLAVQLNIRDGFIQHQSAPYPLSNVLLRINTWLPALNIDSLKVDMDTLSFNVEKDFLKASLHTFGFTTLQLNTALKAQLNLAHLIEAIGYAPLDLKGLCSLDLKANGIFKTSTKSPGTITSVPVFNFNFSLDDGWIKLATKPEAFQQIKLKGNIQCTSNDYKNTSIQIDQFSAKALNNTISGFFKLRDLKDKWVDAQLKTSVQLSDLKSIIPLDSLTLSGLLNVDVTTKGAFQPEKRKMPVTAGALSLKDGFIQTKYYPQPIKDIQLNGNFIATGTALKDLRVDIKPLSFSFENKPFQINASLYDFDQLHYAIQAKGDIDLGRIYKVYPIEGIDVNGWLQANLNLSGSKADAMSGRYSKLHNAGTLAVNDFKVKMDAFPLPMLIHKGLFKFNGDKMWFNDFKATYGKSDITLNGYLQQAVEYFITGNGVLKGNFKLNSTSLNVDEFMSADVATVSKDTAIQKGNPSNAPTTTGVVIIPSNWDIDFNAQLKQVIFNGILLDTLRATVSIAKGIIGFNETGFGLIGTKVSMEGKYGSITPQKAFFEYHIKAEDFDVKRAYKQIKLFREMATAAGKASGIISLEYDLKGKLDKRMYPILPSLTGGGILSVKKVKMRGFKLLNAVSSKTGKESVKDPDVSKVKIKSTIKNNVISFERFKIKMAGFRLRLEGQSSFDGRLKMRMRLGLPPLGIIGIPINVSGTQENPRIKLGKGTDETLPEAEDNDN